MNDHKCTQFSGLNIVRITQRNSMNYYDILLSKPPFGMYVEFIRM